MPTLGALLKRQRDRHGWTQQEVVERAGLDRSSSYISSIETGKTSPSVDELDALARLFGTTSLDLLREASGITPEWEFEPNSDLVQYRTPVEGDRADPLRPFSKGRDQKGCGLEDEPHRSGGNYYVTTINFNHAACVRRYRRTA